MEISTLFPMFTTELLDATKSFYMLLGFEVVFDGDWYIHLMSKDNPQVQIGFLLPAHESQPPVFQSQFQAGGAFLGIEVSDVDAVYAKVKAMGIPIEMDIRDEPWGQRHFAILDPNGIALDFLTQKEPSEEYKAQYLTAE